MQKKWLVGMAVLAVALFLLPFAPWFKGNDQSEERTVPGNETAGSYNRTMSAKQEKERKMAILRSDMEATALLCTTECAKDFRKLLAQGGDGEDKEKHIRRLMADHPHMVYIRWMTGDRSVARGSVPEPVKDSAETHLNKAETSVKSGKKYVSPTIKDGSVRYVVMGIPDERYQGQGIVGLVKQNVVEAVERHQRRNLRLVPYPANGKYRVKTVKPNSTQQKSVRSGEDNGNASHYRVDEVVVRFERDPSPQQMELIKKEISAVSVRKLGYTYLFRSRSMDAERMIAYFRDRWHPRYVEPHYLYLTNEAVGPDPAIPSDEVPIVPNDALYSQYQWNLPTIETEKGWNLSKGSDDVIVAVLDTGVQRDHPDLQGRLVEGINILDESAYPEDDVGHGTHVAGIIAAAVNNGEGVAGMSWYNKIMPVKVLDENGAGSTYSVAEGIIWATDHGAKVINMSLGNYAQADFLHDAVRYAYDRDVVIVAASGNDNTDRPGYPAAYPEVFAVAATDYNGNRASFSNYGDYIDVAAPGASIASTYPGGQYAALSGTSMASPHVSALAALIRSANPELNNEEVMEIMRTSAIDMGDSGKDIYFGYGQIDVRRALEAAGQSTVSLQRFPLRLADRLQRIVDKYTGTPSRP